MTATGARDTLIAFQRDMGVGKDDHGGKIEDWQEFASEYAAVRFGTGQERRQAAQERASQSAAFNVIANSLTLALTPSDRIAGYLGTNWDIVGVSIFGDEVDITAVRTAA